MFVWFESAKNPVCIATIEMKLVDFFSRVATAMLLILAQQDELQTAQSSIELYDSMSYRFGSDIGSLQEGHSFTPRSAV